MTSIWELANPQLRDIAVYEAGKPIEETARELGVDPEAIIKLASNENPLGPSPKAIQAMRAALDNAHLYPDGSGFYLCKAIAAKLGLAPENIILGNGSNEALEFLGHAFLDGEREDEVIASEYAFVVYKLIATSFGARVIEVPSPDYQQDLEGMLEAVTPRTRLIFIPNPNNPTGTLVSQRKIDSFVSRVPEQVIVVLDEAAFGHRRCEFCDGERRRRLCGIRKTAATENHRATAQRLWLTRVGPHFGRQHGGKYEMRRSTEGDSRLRKLTNVWVWYWVWYAFRDQSNLFAGFGNS